MCAHDATYTQDNEANGGAGCAKCNAERRAKSQTALIMACVEVGQSAVWYPAQTVGQAEQYAALSNADYERMSAEMSESDGIVEHYNSSTEGHW